MFPLPHKLNINNKCYIVEKQLGQGAEGAVFKGYDENNPNTPLAIKVCSNMRDDELKFLQKHLLQKDHPNIIRYFDIQVKTLELPYFIFVMELGEGNLLDKVIQRRQNIEFNEVLEISFQIARGIQSIHNLGFMHRDMKPENIILVKDQWKICDFGLSRYKLSSKLTKQIGTAYYIAPEMFFQSDDQQNIEQYDQKVDVWALGCIIYEIYTTNLFFNGNSFDAVSKLVQKFTTDNECGIPEDGRFNCLPEPLGKIVKKMLIVDSEQRITINDVINEISELLPNHKEIKKNNEAFNTYKPSVNVLTTQKAQQNNTPPQGAIPQFPGQPLANNQFNQFNKIPQQNNQQKNQISALQGQKIVFQQPTQFPQNPTNFQNPSAVQNPQILQPPSHQNPSQLNQNQKLPQPPQHIQFTSNTQNPQAAQPFLPNSAVPITQNVPQINIQAQQPAQISQNTQQQQWNPHPTQQLTPQQFQSKPLQAGQVAYQAPPTLFPQQMNQNAFKTNLVNDQPKPIFGQPQSMQVGGLQVQQNSQAGLPQQTQPPIKIIPFAQNIQQQNHQITNQNLQQPIQENKSHNNVIQLSQAEALNNNSQLFNDKQSEVQNANNVQLTSQEYQQQLSQQILNLNVREKYQKQVMDLLPENQTLSKEVFHILAPQLIKKLLLEILSQKKQPTYNQSQGNGSY